MRDRLLDYLRPLDGCVVAYSGGVDSAVVAKAAQLVLGEKALAVTGVSASLASGELENARVVARQIGIRHIELGTTEFGKAEYLQNAPDRCFHCKTELYSQLAAHLDDWGVRTIVNGANRDDLGDYRPGLIAAANYRVLSPLADCGFTKADVRQLAEAWNLPVWDKPASPCLSSRVAYGEAVTPERLAMIDQAESWLRSQGLATCRVRYHRGDLARIEVPASELSRLATEELRISLAAHLRGLGFKFITLDLDGFRSGSLNALVQIAPQ
jgi:uncharacterized protein